MQILRQAPVIKRSLSTIVWLLYTWVITSPVLISEKTAYLKLKCSDINLFVDFQDKRQIFLQTKSLLLMRTGLKYTNVAT